MPRTGRLLAAAILVFVATFPARAQTIYGTGVQATSLNNINVGGPSNWKVAYRFVSPYTSTITGGIYYRIFSTTKPGYSGGTLGTIVASIASDNAGSPGSTLSTCTGANVGNFPVLTCSAAVTAGTTYYLVFTNTDGSPTANFASVDGLYDVGGVADPNLPYTTLISNSSTWAVYPTVQPILQLNYANGHASGNGYMEVWINTSAVTLSGSTQARETFTPTVTRTAQSVQIGPGAIAGTTVTLALGTGTVIETGTLPAPGATGWATYNFTTPRTLASGTAYQLILSGTGVAYPIRKGTNQAFTSETYFPDGHAQFSTNSGSTWTDFNDENGNPSTLGDLEFSFILGNWYGLLNPVSGAGACSPANLSFAQRCALVDWSSAGVPGGIPSATWTQSGSTITATSGDRTSTIQTALNACGTSHFVLLGPGNFSVTHLSIPSNCTLRGSGTLTAGGTIVNTTGTSGSVYSLGSGGPNFSAPANTAITSGATQGSTTIGVASASGISIGTLLAVSELNDPAYVTINTSNGSCTWCDGAGNDGGIRARGQVVLVTGVSGTTLTISPGLYTNYGSAAGTGPALVYPFAAGAINAGVENLQTFANGTGYAQVYLMTACLDCWVKGVFNNYADGDHLDAYWSLHDEIRDSYFSNAYIHLPGSTDADVDLAFKTSATLVENNILERLHVGMMAEWGAAGNVYGYNYEIGNFDSTSTNVLQGFIVFHGAHPQFNLFEGNIGNNLTMDAFWGTGSNNTTFRNHFRATDTLASPEAPGRNVVNWGSTTLAFQQMMGEQLAFPYTNINSIGNVHGSADANTAAATAKYNSGASPFTSTIVPSATRTYDHFFSAISIGYNTGSDTNGAGVASFSSGPGPTAGYWVGKATGTFFQHGNFDIASAAILWNASFARTLPTSLYKSAKPSWFGSVPWPPIGPEVTGGTEDNAILQGHVYAIPAKKCYDSEARDANGIKLFDPNVCYAAVAPPPPPPPPNPPVMHRPVIF